MNTDASEEPQDEHIATDIASLLKGTPRARARGVPHTFIEAETPREDVAKGNMRGLPEAARAPGNGCML